MRAVLGRLARSIHGRTAHLNYGRDIVQGWATGHLRSLEGPGRVLDLGPGPGDDLRALRDAMPSRSPDLHGIELGSSYIAACRAAGIVVHELDLESAVLPLEDASVDVVIANQVLEHVKEVFWILSEVGRVLRPAGLFLVGVPNLAALHGRLGLLLGMQPTAIEPLGPHVRGFTSGGLRRLVEAGGVFRVTASGGANFYPLPPALAGPAARLLPDLAVSIFLRLERTDEGGRYIDGVDIDGLETPFFRGPT